MALPTFDGGGGEMLCEWFLVYVIHTFIYTLLFTQASQSDNTMFP